MKSSIKKFEAQAIKNADKVKGGNNGGTKLIAISIDDARNHA